MPCIRGASTSGRSGTSASAVLRIQAGRRRRARGAPRDHLTELLAAPTSGRSQRTGTGVAPTFHVANALITISGELRKPRVDAVADADALGRHRAGELARAAVELGRGEGLLAPVDADVRAAPSHRVAPPPAVAAVERASFPGLPPSRLSATVWGAEDRAAQHLVEAQLAGLDEVALRARREPARRDRSGTPSSG